MRRTEEKKRWKKFINQNNGQINIIEKITQGPLILNVQKEDQKKGFRLKIKTWKIRVLIKSITCKEGKKIC